MSFLQSAMLFLQSAGIVGIPLVFVLLALLTQVGRATHVRLRHRERTKVEGSHCEILVVGIVGACVGLLGTFVGVWVSAGAITTAGQIGTALAWSMIRVALVPSIIGFAILAVASIAWIMLHYWDRRSVGAIVLIPAVLASASCGENGSGDTDHALRQDSAGVTIVRNRGGDRPFGGRIERLADLTTPDEALVAVPWGIAVDRVAERVYVADGPGRRVVVFDAVGRLLGEMGRPGGGPGEFGQASALAMTACTTAACREAGVLVVLDTRRFVLSRWSSEGEFLGEEQIPGDYWGPGFAIGPDWFATVTSRTSGMRVEQRLRIRTGGESRIVHEVVQEMSMMELGCATLPAPRVFAPDVVWAHRGDTFYYLNGAGYRIDAFVGGRVVGSFRRTVAPLTVSRSMAMDRLRLAPGPHQGLMRQCGASAEQLVNAIGHEDRLASVAWLAVDPGGRLWVARRTSGFAPESIDVLDTDGEYLGTHETSVVPVAFLSESRFVGMRLDLATGQLQPSIYQVGVAATRPPIVPVRPSGQATAGNRQTAKIADEGADVAAPPAANPAGLREFRDCPACPLMVELPTGRYLMGRPDEEEERLGLHEDSRRTPFSRDAERPQVAIEIGHTIAMGKYEITFAEWDHCVDAGGCAYRPTDREFGRDRRPVIHVSRLDAEEYLAWLRDVTGLPYRLPSNAEWEYAARAGTRTARWWGDELGEARAVCDGCGSSWDDRATAPVGSFPANPWGLHDMLSNVSELVADCWHDTYEGHPTDGSPRLAAPAGWPNGECRRATWRGGGWPYFSWTVRAAARSGGNMGLGYRGDHPRVGGGKGFRVARTVASR